MTSSRKEFKYTKYIKLVGRESIVKRASNEPNFIPREPIFPKVVPVACPVRASLGVLGRKWALLILRDIAFYRNVRFSDILKSNHGLTPRVLSFRLRELQREGLITRSVRRGNDKDIFYDLTLKG